MKFGTGLMAAACAAVAGLAAQSAQAATDLVFCNKTGAKINIAVVYVDNTTNKWTLSAWHIRSPGQCQSFGTIKTGLFYYYAEKEGGQVTWPSGSGIERRYCVPRVRVKREMNASSCGAGEKTYGFRGRVPESAKYTFTFS